MTMKELLPTSRQPQRELRQSASQLQGTAPEWSAGWYKAYPDSPRRLNEVYQSVGVSFAIVQDGQALHQWVRCRDFLGDAWRAMKTGVAYGPVYGFSFPDTYHWEEGPLLLALKQDENFAPDFLRLAVEAIESKGGRWGCCIKQHSALFTADPFWKSSSVALSLITMLIRMGCSVSPHPATVAHIGEYDAEDWDEGLDEVASELSECVDTTKMIRALIVPEAAEVLATQKVSDEMWHHNHGCLSMFKRGRNEASVFRKYMPKFYTEVMRRAK